MLHVHSLFAHLQMFQLVLLTPQMGWELMREDTVWKTLTPPMEAARFCPVTTAELAAVLAWCAS